MNSKMTRNSKVLTTEPKKQDKTKQSKTKKTKRTTRTGTESQKWRLHGGLSVGMWEGERGKNLQRISSINGR